MNPRQLPSAIGTIVLSLVLNGWLASAEDVDFQSHVLPLLEAKCIDCHNAESAESNLRLDTMAYALRGGDSGEAAIRPGDPDASYLIQRVMSANSDERMPPDEPPLTAEEVGLLRRWIEQSRDWEQVRQTLGTEKYDHWAFQPIARPTHPEPVARGGNATSSPHPIDRFIDAKLDEHSLQRSPRADNVKLIRRLYLVLHGLPPTAEQITSFMTDKSPEAWDHLIEELLNSPHYGERLATLWLDLVHFGETHGFETNRERPHAWRYRDWVIRAFNEDLPYDDFIRAQIAGDQYGYPEATGFLVAGPHDIVKGQDPLLSLVQRQDELTDMINTTGTAFLGLTLGCARCHNHKFDPVTQTDFYSLQAIFAGVTHADRALPLTASQESQRAELTARASRLEQRLLPFTRPYQASQPTVGNEAKSVVRVRPAVNSRLNIDRFDPVKAKFIRFTIEKTNQGEPCLDELEIFSGEANVALSSQGAKASSSGDFVHELHKLPHVNDGNYGNSKSWISSVVSGGWVQIEFPEETVVDRVVWARDRSGQFADRTAIEYRIEASLDGQTWKLCSSEQDRAAYVDGGKTEPVYAFDSFPPSLAHKGRALLEELTSIKQELATVYAPSLAYAGTFSPPPTTFRLYRGEANAPREQVPPGVPRFLLGFELPFDAPEPERRKSLAEWLTGPENPLTARVIVNRLWQHHFGTGIVDTPSDFGLNGTTPTHPELLDFLASELIENDWSLKHIHRLILTSQTWQQDSRPQQDAMKTDGDCRLLWRFPPRRLEAEAIRDCMLASTGVLDLHGGGPGFSAFQVDLENVRHYFPKSDFGPEDWRRMVYMTKVRQEKDAVFGVFDCPDFSQVVPKRSRSTTPLQALNLLNSRFVMQQSELFVRRLVAEASTAEERVNLAFRLCYGREAEQVEAESALQFISETDWVQFARALLNSNEFVFIP